MRIFILLAALVPLSGAAQAASLTLACLDVGRMVEACRDNATEFGQATGHEVRVVTAPSVDRLALDEYRALFSVGSSRLDVLQFPDAWVPALQDDLVPVDADSEGSSSFVPAALVGSVAGGQSVGWPQHLAITVLFFRSDLLEEGTPVWAALRDQLVNAPADGAKRVSLGGADPALFSFFLDWFYATGSSALDDREAVQKSLTLLMDFIGPVALPGTARMRTTSARQSFTAGDTAAFIGRSTQSPHLGQSDIADRIAETPLPTFRDSPEDASVLVSTWYVGTSRHSEEREAARELAAYLASEPVQRANAVKYGLAPAIAELYNDPTVTSTGPLFVQIAGLLGRMQGPPTQKFGATYLDLVDSIAESIRSLLLGNGDITTATQQIQRAVQRANRARTN